MNLKKSIKLNAFLNRKQKKLGQKRYYYKIEPKTAFFYSSSLKTVFVPARPYKHTSFKTTLILQCKTTKKGKRRVEEEETNLWMIQLHLVCWVLFHAY